jgi:hypothetical protein
MTGLRSSSSVTWTVGPVGAAGCAVEEVARPLAAGTEVFCGVASVCGVCAACGPEAFCGSACCRAEAARGAASASDAAKRKETSATLLRLTERRALIEPS